MVDGDEVKALKTIKDFALPSHLVNVVNVGWPEFGELLGRPDRRGDKASYVTLLSANGGLGKTTFALTACAMFNCKRLKQYSIFNSLEMAPFQLAIDIAEKNISNLDDMFIIVESDIEKYLAKLDELLNTLAEDASVFIVCDSLQLLRHNKTGNFSEALNIFYEWIKKRSENTKQVLRALFISQVTKANKIKGPNSIVHCIDRHINLFFDKEKKKFYAECVEKNRGGLVGNKMEYQFVSGGINLVSNSQ